MTDTEQKARDALNDVAKDRWKNDRRCLWTKRHTRENTGSIEAMCRALEAHNATKAEFEAFRRDVSEAARKAVEDLNAACYATGYLSRFILPKPDPLDEALKELDWCAPEKASDLLRAALAARGLEIREVKP